MLKNLNTSILLDFYGAMITDKQRDAIDLYYNNDLSLSEIAEHLSVTRQGVRDLIKRGEVTLLDCENKLSLINKFYTIGKALNNIKMSLNEIEAISISDTQMLHIINVKKNINEIEELI